MKITRMNPAEINRLRAEIMPALEKACMDALGLTVTWQKARYGDNYTDVTLRFAVHDRNGSPAGPEAEAFKMLASSYGLKPEDLGREITIEGRRLQIVGLRPRAPKKPILLKAEDGTLRIAGRDLVRLRLEDANGARN